MHARAGAAGGVDRAPRRRQPAAFAYVAKRSAEKRADASTGDGAVRTRVASRQPSHEQGKRTARVQAGGQCLLPTPGQ